MSQYVEVLLCAQTGSYQSDKAAEDAQTATLSVLNDAYLGHDVKHQNVKSYFSI